MKILLFSVFFFYSYSACATSIPVLVADDVLQFYKRVKAQHNLDQLNDFSSLPQGRDLIDLIILERALKLGQCECTLAFNNSGLYGRNLQLVKSGQFVMTVDSVWQQDTLNEQDNLLISAPIIKKGQYDVGLYTSALNKKALNIYSPEQITHLTAASNRYWSADWATLHQLAPKKFAHVDSWYTMVKVINRQMADFTLLHFRNSQDLSIKLGNATLKPIPNVKAILWDSRHFALSKKHPLSQQVFTALNIGLEKLERQGLINKAYQDIGISSPKTQNWTVLNPTPPMAEQQHLN